LLCVHSATAGGGERMALAEAECLKEHFELIISIPDGPLRPSFAAHGEIVDGTVSLPLWGAGARRWVGRSVRTVTRGARLARLIRRRRVDAVLTSSSVLASPVLAARLARVPVVVHVRDVPASRLAPLVFKLEARLAQTVIVISNGQKPYFSNARARIVLIPDGIALPGPGDAASAPRTGFGDPLRLCVVGGIDPRKGQDVAVEALAFLRNEGVDATLELVGRTIDPMFAADVRTRAEELSLGERVRFVGELDDVRPHLRDVDVVIAPSRGEWTPLSLMEAMALEKPVVAASVGGVPDVVTDGRTGILVPPDDPRRLADAIREIIEDPTGAAAMAQCARASIEARFAIGRTLEAVNRELQLVAPISA
jgi:glycosyltransferase involved in cell wall biosynthesis